MTLKKLLALYHEHQCSFNKSSSIESFNHSANQLRRLLGEDLPIESVSQIQVQGFVAKRREEVKPISVNKDLRYLKASLRYAVELGFLAELPVKIKMMRCPKKRDLPLLTKEQIEALIHSAKGCYKIIIHLAAVTGMRLGEILSLRWVCIITAENRILVRGENAKSHQHRSIPVSDKTLLLLQQYRKRVKFSGDNDLCFHTYKGTPKNTNNVSHQLQTIWKRAGVYRKGNPTLHHLRHRFCSEIIRQGASIETARVLMGHSSWEVTQLYTRTDDEQKRKAVAAVEF